MVTVNNTELETFKSHQAEMGWSNREVAQYLGRHVKTIEAWRSGTNPIDPMAMKMMRFAISYAKHARAKKVKPSDFDRIT